MRKRLLGMIMTLAIVVSLFAAFPPQAQADTTFGPFTVGNMTWRVVIPTGQTRGTLTIERRSGTGVPTSVPIPNYTSGAAPWSGHSANVDRIVLGDGITEIGNWAFANFGNLQFMFVKGNVTRIGNDALRGCNNFAAFIDDSGGAWVSKTFSQPMTIGSSAFFGCGSLEGLLIPAVTSIGADAFVGCKSLKTIDAGADGRVRMVQGVVVEMNTAATPQPVRVIKAPIGIDGNTAAGEYTIPAGITTIDAEAFAYLTKITRFIVPDSVTTIRDRAFAYIGDPASAIYSGLKTAIFMGDAPTSFGRDVFLGIDDTEFVIQYYPNGLRWTSPRWQGYRTAVNNSRLELDRYFIVMDKGTTAELRATVHPTTALQEVSWSTIPAASTVASVTGKSSIRDVVGVISGLDVGMTTIRATAASGAIVDCTVIVLEKAVAPISVILDKSQITTTLGADPAPTLTAIVHPFPETSAEQEQLAESLIWSSSNPAVAIVSAAAPESLIRDLIIRAVGTTTITVRTADGRSSASCTVTVTAAPTFVPVTSIVLSTTTIAMGTRINLNDVSSVRPANATWQFITWEIVDQQTGGLTPVYNGVITAPVGQTGTIVVQATVLKGRADKDPPWNFSDDVPYVQRFTISIVDFIPVTSITDVPNLAFAGVPLDLTATVNPPGASFKDVEWELVSENAGVSQADIVRGVIIAQWPGTVTVRARVPNGLRTGTEQGDRRDYTQTFVIKVDPYIANSFTLRANPGGSVNTAPTQLAGGEKVTITATPALGYIFAGWNTTNGGEFANAGSSSTVFTMPSNSTTVTAFFTYIGLPGGNPGDISGGTVLPTPIHYFTHNSLYIRNSGVSFGHVTIRDFHLFSHVSLDGRQLTQGAHYTTGRTGAGFTEIILANGYLDALYQGPHTLQVHFKDYIVVSAVFTVLWQGQMSQSFSDVYSSDWFFSSVEFVTARGWMTARSQEPKLFRPSDSVTQGEVIDALYRMAGTPTILNQYGQPLQGRDASYEWVRQNGILPLGGHYNLSSGIARQDVCVLFNRLVTVLRMTYPVIRPAPSFADDWQIDANARTAVTNLYRAGIIGGRTSSTFVPLSQMTRAEFASLLHRFTEAMSGW